MYEEERTVNVEDDSVSLFSVHLADRVSMSDLGAIAISSDGVSTGCDLVGDLSWQEISNRAILIQNL